MKTFVSLFVALLALSATRLAAAGDACVLWQDNHRVGARYQLALQDPHLARVAGEPWGPSGRRVTGATLAVHELVPQHPGYKWRDNISSAEVFAGDTDITLYLFLGDNFDGEVVQLNCKQGHRCWIDDLQGWNDRVHSAICQREFPQQPSQTSLDVLEVPSKELVSPIRSGFAQRYAANSDLDGASMEETQVVWTTTQSRCRAKAGYWAKWGINCPTHWSYAYRDELRITQAAQLDLDMWPSDYDVDVDLYVRPTAYNGRFYFHPTMYYLWVESGTWHSKVWNGIVASLNGYVWKQPITEAQKAAGDSVGLAQELNESLQEALGYQLIATFASNGGLSYKKFADGTKSDRLSWRKQGGSMLTGMQRVQMTHTCSVAKEYNSYYTETPSPTAHGTSCSNNVPVDAFAPVLRISKQRVPWEWAHVVVEVIPFDVVSLLYRDVQEMSRDWPTTVLDIGGLLEKRDAADDDGHDGSSAGEQPIFGGELPELEASLAEIRAVYAETADTPALVDDELTDEQLEEICGPEPAPVDEPEIEANPELEPAFSELELAERY